MDLWTIIKVVVRRWYAVLPVLALTAVVAYQVAYRAPPTYQANGSALLVSPNLTTGIEGDLVKQNPYLLFTGSLNITASALVRVLDDTAVRASYVEAGLLDDYEIGVDPSTPTIGITAIGDEPEIVVATVKRLLRDVNARLGELQSTADAPDDRRIGIEELVNPTEAVSLRGNVGRTMATVGVLGMLLAVGVALLWEAAAAARKRSRAISGERRHQDERDKRRARKESAQPTSGSSQLASFESTDERSGEQLAAGVGAEVGASPAERAQDPKH